MGSEPKSIHQLRIAMREVMKDTKAEELANHIKHFVKQNKSDSQIYDRIRDNLVNSADEEVRKFVEMIQRPFYTRSSILNLGLSVFQLAISAFLLVLGILVISPSILGVRVIDFIQQLAGGQAGNGAANIVDVVLFIAGIAFVADAFTHLRSAAFFLRVAGIEVQEPGEKEPNARR